MLKTVKVLFGRELMVNSLLKRFLIGIWRRILIVNMKKYSEQFNFGNNIYEVVVKDYDDYNCIGNVFLVKNNKKYIVYSEVYHGEFSDFVKADENHRHYKYLSIFKDYQKQIERGNLKEMNDEDIHYADIKRYMFNATKILCVIFIICSILAIRECSIEESKKKEALAPVVINIELKRFELISYRSPKHYYVSLKDIDTKLVYNDNYVSKHCNNYQNNAIGDQFNIQVSNMKTKDESRKWLSFNNLESVFCR